MRECAGRGGPESVARLRAAMIVSLLPASSAAILRFLAATPAALVLWLAVSTTAFAQDDEAALAIADGTRVEAARQSLCVASAEAAAGDSTYRNDRASRAGGRESFALRCDGSLARGWRGIFSDRIDHFWGESTAPRTIGTLKEAYVSGHHGAQLLFDFGRINLRNGVGLAYNPTDYFRSDAVRAALSIDPDTLRNERLGTVMARVQSLWPTGSLTAVLAPRIGTHSSDATFDPDFAATNSRTRWLLVLSQRLGAAFQPQLSVTGAEGEPPQAGLDATFLLNRATVAYIEGSWGRGASNVAASAGGASTPPSAPAPDRTFHSRLSTGVTYTTAYELSVTLEYEYDDAAAGRREWAALREGPVETYVSYRQYAGAQGEPATRQSWAAYAHWDDLGILHLSLTTFARFDPLDGSRLGWAELRYRWARTGLAVQWQRSAGGPKDSLVHWPDRQSWLALIDYYF